MKLTRKTKSNLLALMILLVMVLVYSRPYSFSEIMPKLADAPITKCEAEYYAQEADENGKPKYITTYKEFDVNGEEYAQLMEKLESVTYRKRLIWALSSGKNTGGYSIDYPYSIITFYQEGRVYQYCLFNSALAAGHVGEKLDYKPQGGQKFQAEVTEFIHTHGTIINEEVRQY